MRDSSNSELDSRSDSIRVWGQAVLAAHERIRAVVRRTPIEEISDLVPDCGSRVYAKLENEQETGSFKLRCETNRMLQLTPPEKARGIVAASNGSHGLGVAAAAGAAGGTFDRTFNSKW